MSLDETMREMTELLIRDDTKDQWLEVSKRIVFDRCGQRRYEPERPHTVSLHEGYRNHEERCILVTETFEEMLDYLKSDRDMKKHLIKWGRW